MGKKYEGEEKIPEQYQKKRTPGKYLNAKRRRKDMYVYMYVVLVLCTTHRREERKIEKKKDI